MLSGNVAWSVFLSCLKLIFPNNKHAETVLNTAEKRWRNLYECIINPTLMEGDHISKANKDSTNDDLVENLQLISSLDIPIICMDFTVAWNSAESSKPGT